MTMTKRELIEQLEKYPDDMEIRIKDRKQPGDMYTFVEIPTIRIDLIEEAKYRSDSIATMGENDGANRPIILLS